MYIALESDLEQDFQMKKTKTAVVGYAERSLCINECCGNEDFD